ncbi:hypothetical protein EDD18DRAFT_1178404 [Armillaria luteobubalina]|uniref:Uncharacterized protein n=1 Tax=Armillaria luteobubalina TaxID=153913 RepID=A0AA39ULX8_9AGAR|nr:hypothetical protein EDD18DRAFT_1178404 [Armillaria luteobubalina]
MITRRPRQAFREGAAAFPWKLMQTKLPKDCNPQTASPLFSVIPPEIRNIIFQLALRSYPDKSRPYPGNAYHFRPGYEYGQRIDTALLLTCRLIYNETRLLPITSNEHVFWCDRGPPGSRTKPAIYFSRMASEQQDVVDCVHFFAQQYWLEQTFPKICSTAGLRPRKLKITIRHSDWWYWENNQLLALKEEWTDKMSLLRRLEEFEIELETFERDKDQMLAIAQKIRNWKIKLWDGRKLSTEGCPFVHDKWTGTSVFERNIGYDREGNVWVQWPRIAGPAAPLVYHTVTVKWTAV